MEREIYIFLNHIDAPKRYFTLTLDELLIALIGMGLLILSNHKFIASLLGLGLLSMLRALKKGQNPKVLLVLAYWHFPKAITQFFLTDLPASHHRVWVA